MKVIYYFSRQKFFFFLNSNFEKLRFSIIFDNFTGIIKHVFPIDTTTNCSSCSRSSSIISISSAIHYKPVLPLSMLLFKVLI